MDLRMDGASLKRTQVATRGVAPTVATLVVNGPFNITGRGDTPSRARIFTCRPTSAAQEETCARTIFSKLASRAFRRPVTDADLRPLLNFFRDGRATGDFDDGKWAANRTDLDCGWEKQGFPGLAACQRRITSQAMTVLPAPVGAMTRGFTCLARCSTAALTAASW